MDLPQRVTPGFEEAYLPLRDAIRQVFTPSVIGGEILDREHELFALPVKCGGLAIPDPVSTSAPAFATSHYATAIGSRIRSRLVVMLTRLNGNDHNAHCRQVTLSKNRDVQSAQISLPLGSDRFHAL